MYLDLKSKNGHKKKLLMKFATAKNALNYLKNPALNSTISASIHAMEHQLSKIVCLVSIHHVYQTTTSTLLVFILRNIVVFATLMFWAKLHQFN